MRILKKVTDLFNKILYRSDEATTMSDVTFLPSGLGAIKAHMRSLAQKKKDWNITILEDNKGRKVMFDDEFSVYVAHKYWNDFSSMFEDHLESGSIGLGKYLMEAMEENLDELREDLKPALEALFQGREFRAVERAVAQWRARFGIKEHQRADVVVRVEDKIRDIQELHAKLIDVYGEDMGNLEMLLESLRKREPLNSFHVFRQYDFLYGTRIYSVLRRVPLILEVTLDMALMVAQSIVVEDDDALEGVQDHPDVKIVKNVVYPIAQTFTSRFMRDLQDSVQGAFTEEPESGRGERTFDRGRAEDFAKPERPEGRPKSDKVHRRDTR